jgi:hypothetical protein
MHKSYITRFQVSGLRHAVAATAAQAGVRKQSTDNRKQRTEDKW